MKVLKANSLNTMYIIHNNNFPVKTWKPKISYSHVFPRHLATKTDFSTGVAIKSKDIILEKQFSFHPLFLSPWWIFEKSCSAPVG